MLPKKDIRCTHRAKISNENGRVDISYEISYLNRKNKNNFLKRFDGKCTKYYTCNTCFEKCILVVKKCILGIKCTKINGKIR